MDDSHTKRRHDGQAQRERGEWVESSGLRVGSGLSSLLRLGLGVVKVRVKELRLRIRIRIQIRIRIGIWIRVSVEIRGLGWRLLIG